MSVLYHSSLEKYKDLHSRAHIYIAIAQGLSKGPGPPYRSKIKVSQSKPCGYSNFCLKMPEKIQKTRNESDNPWLKNCSKTIKNLPKSKLVIFHKFLDVFSVQNNQVLF